MTQKNAIQSLIDQIYGHNATLARTMAAQSFVDTMTGRDALMAFAQALDAARSDHHGGPYVH